MIGVKSIYYTIWNLNMIYLLNIDYVSEKRSKIYKGD